MVSGSVDGAVQVWNDVGGTERVQTVPENMARHIHFSRDGKTIVCASSAHIRLWDSETGALIRDVLLETKIGRVAVSMDRNEVVVAMDKDTVGVFQMGEKTLCQSERFATVVNCAAYCGWGTSVITGSEDGCVRMWDMSTGGIIGQPLKHESAVMCVAASADGHHVVSGSEDGTVTLWNIANAELAARPVSVENTKRVHCVAVSDDANQVVFGLPLEVHVWDVASGSVTCVTREAGELTDVAVSGDGTRVAYGSKSHFVIVWDVREREEIGRTRCGHTDRIKSVSFSADGRRVASGSQDGTVRVWNVDNGNNIGGPFMHDAAVVCVRLDTEGSRVLSYDWNWFGRLWNTGSGEYLTSTDTSCFEVRLRQISLARLRWQFLPRHTMITEGAAHKHEVLASTPREMIPIGSIYFSATHSQQFWPFCRVLRQDPVEVEQIR